MSASTLASHPGTSAIERAHARWGMSDEATDIARHERLIEALRRVEASAPVASNVPADPFDRDWKKWRKRHNTFLKQQLEAIRCRK